MGYSAESSALPNAGVVVRKWSSEGYVSSFQFLSFLWPDFND